MKKLVVIAGAAALSACGAPEAEEVEAPVIETEEVVEVAPLTDTTWTFGRDDKDYIESIDANGDYLVDEDGVHYDHGTYVLVDGKHCFTSAMTDEGELCWTMPPVVAIGETVEATRDDGAQLTVTRQEYQALVH